MAKSTNERNTENIVRNRLRKLGYYDRNRDILVEEQKSNIEAVRRLLRSASKSGLGGLGAPEFIISSPSSADFLVIVECKGNTKDHASRHVAGVLAGTFKDVPPEARARRIQRFAVDGALHYARFLSREFNVIAVAVAGETGTGSVVSAFLHAKGAKHPKRLRTKTGKDISTLIPWSDYIEHATFDPTVQRMRFDELMAFSRELHDFMRDHAKLTESEKPLMVSGTLIALRNKAFARTFGDYTPEDLQAQWMHVIREEIYKADIPNSKKHSMTQPYASIAVHPELGKSTKAYPRGVLYEQIRMLNEKVWPFISVYHDFDVVGQFYGEFLKYTGGDKKALGIVLTPRHITELFALLANVHKRTHVLDSCAGTGGFLIAAMHQMMRHANTEQERTYIKQHCLIGIEQQPNMYALAASNMILRGDGKANLYQGSCFDDAIIKEVKKKLRERNRSRDTAGMLNPPYSQGDEDLHELVFVKAMLDCLTPHSVGIAIVPLPKMIAPHPVKTEILKYHTLEAVMTMPHELFYPVGRATCIVVFTAHQPHAGTGKKTWFAYWKNDGFVKTKHRGRIDLHGDWQEIRDQWVEAFRNRDERIGVSIKHPVTPEDEWCAEAYMNTDYSSVSASQLGNELKKYFSHVMMSRITFDESQDTNGNETDPATQ